MNEPSEDNRGSQDRVDIGDLVVSVIYSCCLFQTKPPTTPMPITNVSQLIQHVESAAKMSSNIGHASQISQIWHQFKVIQRRPRQIFEIRALCTLYPDCGLMALTERGKVLPVDLLLGLCFIKVSCSFSDQQHSVTSNMQASAQWMSM